MQKMKIIEAETIDELEKRVNEFLASLSTRTVFVKVNGNRVFLLYSE